MKKKMKHILVNIVENTSVNRKLILVTLFKLFKKSRKYRSGRLAKNVDVSLRSVVN